MFLRGLAFFAVFVAFVVALVVAVVGVASDLGGWQAAAVVLAVPPVLVVTGGLLSRSFVRSWRPVRTLIEAAGALADGDYSARVTPTGSRAMRRVVASFNDMAERLETADEQRRRLLADLSHELRTPLTVVRGELEAMLDGVHEPDAGRLEMLMGEVAVLERLLEDLRTLSLLEAGRLELHPEPTDVNALVEDVATAHRRQASDMDVDVDVDLDPAVGELVIDPVRVREVLSNLTVNALRAMPEGGTLRLATAATDGAHRIEVADTGIGIAPDELERVFDRFHKGSTSRGSGLGLTISRDLVQAHGGEIFIDSKLGEGTVVVVTLPAPGVSRR